MKIVTAAAALAASMAALAEPVSIGDAFRAAESCASDPSVGVGKVKYVVPWISDGKTIGYIAPCEGNRVLVLSADTELPPVVAVTDGTIGSVSGSGVLDVMAVNVREAADVVESERSPKRTFSSASSGKPLSSVVSGNRRTWSRLGVGKAPRMSLSVPSVTPDLEEDDYVIPGFEEGGRYTHWGQSAPRELDDKYVQFNGVYAGFVGWPLYNYYMVWRKMWGREGGIGAATMPIYPVYSGTTRYGRYDLGVMYGKGISGNSFGIFADGFRPRDFYPCGCVATAYAAMFQCMNVTGCVSVSRLVYSPHSPTHNPYQYDEDFNIATNYSSAGGAYFTADDPPQSNDSGELMDYEKYVSTVPGLYDWKSLPWSYGGRARTNMYYGIEGVHANIARLAYTPVSFNSIDADGSLMAAGARELCGRVTYNNGVLVGMKYRRGIATCEVSNMVHAVRESSAFPGFGRFGYIANRWDGPTAGKIIRAGNPVAISIHSPSYGNHAVLAVGRKKILGQNYTRLFMGWNGDSDSWYFLDGFVEIVTKKYTFTSVRNMNAIGGYDGAAVPVHGKVVDTSGRPVGGVPVTLYNLRDSLRTDVLTGDDGYFRGWVRVSPKGASATSSDRFNYRIYCYYTASGTESVQFTANSYSIGDGGYRNGRYDDFDSWAPQFPTQTVTFVVSPARRNGYVYGSGTSFDTARTEAVSLLKPLVVVAGTSGTLSEADRFVASLPDKASKKFVFYFVDGSDAAFAVRDSGYSMMVVDPRKFRKNRLWTPESGVIRHGSFDNARDFSELLNEAWDAFDKEYLWSDHL